MIIGQENNRWDSMPIKFEQTDLREKINCSMNGTEKFHQIDGHKKSPFFQFAKNVAKTYNGEDYNTIESVAWTNILKVAHQTYSKYLPNEKPELITEYCAAFKTISMEIQIVKPDILLFLTGPYYDKYIKMLFKEVSYSPVCEEHTIRAFARLSHECFPKNTFRLYHPGYLARQKSKRWHPILEKLKII